MKKDTLIRLALRVYDLTSLNIYLLDHKDEVFFHHEANVIPTFMPTLSKKTLKSFSKESKKNYKNVHLFTNEWGLNFLAIAFSLIRDFTVIIGPFLTLTPNMPSYTEKYHLSHYEEEVLENFLNKLQVLSKDEYLGYASVLQLFEQMAIRPIKLIKVEEQEKNHLQHPPIKRKEENSHEQLIQLRYQIEEDFLHLVEQGNKHEALRLIQNSHSPFSFPERFPNEPLLRLKNFAIVFNTLLRSAARNQRVPFLFIHEISEKYALKIERQRSLNNLRKLYVDMISDYCDLITKHSLSEYSETIRSVMTHLMIHYDQKIDQQELAGKCFVHPHHLSRLFKQETGMTMGAYQEKLRLNRAKYLLRNKRDSIEEISWVVGYKDASYFSRVFKKRVGMTPTDYRNR